MEYLNILLPNNRVLTLGYNHADSAYDWNKKYSQLFPMRIVA